MVQQTSRAELPQPQLVLTCAEVYRQMGFVPLATYVTTHQLENGRPVCSCYKGADCDNAGKHPIGKYSDINTPDKGYSQVYHALQAESAKGLSVNLALRAGPMSGIFVVDLDKKEGVDGVAAFDRWLNMAGLSAEDVSTTLRAKSGGGGTHYVFRYPKDFDIALSNSSKIFGAGIDIKSTGAPFHVYPSVHKYGGKYEWVQWVQPTEAPEALAKAAQKKVYVGVGGVAETPDIETVQAFAKKLAGRKEDDKLKAAGKNLLQLLEGGAIAQEGGGYAAYLALTFQLGNKWPDADPDILAGYLEDGIQARNDLRPSSKHTLTSVRVMIKGAQAKVAEHKNSWKGKITLTEDAKPKPTTNNVALFLQHHPDWEDVLAFNERANDIVFTRRPPFTSGNHEHVFPRRVKDVDYTRIEMWLEQKAELIGARTDSIMRGCEVAAREKTFEPFRDYLQALPAWDGVPRAYRWLTLFAGANDTTIVHEMGFRWLIACVFRTFVPGGKADNVLILEGLQGKKKSSLLESLLPHSDLFLDDLPDPTTKDAKLLLHGPVIVELAELASFRRAENDHMKSFLTTKVDKLRPPYGRNTESMPRRCMFAGTTNDELYLKDPTGNRRYWPVSITKADPFALAAVRDQLWAEVMTAYRQGYKHYFESDELERLAEQQQYERLETDPWAETLGNYLSWREEVFAALYAAEMQGNAAALKHAKDLIMSQPGAMFSVLGVDAMSAEQLRVSFSTHRKHYAGPTQDELYIQALGIKDIEKRNKITDRRIREINNRLGYRNETTWVDRRSQKIWVRKTLLPNPTVMTSYGNAQGNAITS